LLLLLLHALVLLMFVHNLLHSVLNAFEDRIARVLGQGFPCGQHRRRGSGKGNQALLRRSCFAK
jgi:hypothetical protein